MKVASRIDSRITYGILLVLLLAPALAAQAPAILWRFDLRDSPYGQAAAGDIDGDGRLEIVIGCYRNDSCVYALNAEDGSLLWKYNTTDWQEGCNDVAPLLADIDRDGVDEVFVASSCNGWTYRFDGSNGAVLWKSATRGSDSPPTLADIDGDGTAELLHGDFGGHVVCFSAPDGALEWDLAVDTRATIQTAPTLLDADGDGGWDFVVATWNTREGDTNTVRAYRCSDRTLLWSRPLAKFTYHGTAVTDFDADGKPELCIGDYTGALYTLNAEDGSIAWTVASHGEYHYVGSPVSTADLDGDGRPEAVYVSWNLVVAVRNDGSLLWSYTIPAYATSFRGAALTDVDGDALPDVVFGTYAGELTALRGLDGTPLWSVDLGADYGGPDAFELGQAPLVADFDGDGTLDVFIAGGHTEYPDFSGNYGRAWALRIGRGAGPPWRMFQGSVLRGGCLLPEQPTAVEDAAVLPSRGIALYPHPVKGIVHLQTAGLRHASVYDALGRLVRSGASDSDRLTLDLTGAAPGVYHAVLQTAQGVRTQAFVLR